MKKTFSVLLLLLAVALSLAVTSCKKNALTIEQKAALGEIETLWGEIIVSIQNQDVEKFLSFCSENVLKEYSRKSIEDYLKETFKQMAGKARTDYEIASAKFNKEVTEATVAFKSRRKKDFIKENGKWVIKNL